MLISQSTPKSQKPCPEDRVLPATCRFLVLKKPYWLAPLRGSGAGGLRDLKKLRMTRQESENSQGTRLGVSENRGGGGYLLGVLVIRESYNLGSTRGVPYFRQPPCSDV